MPTKAVVRSAPQKPRETERALPVGIYGGCTADERWAKDLVDLPIADRVAILDQRLRDQAHRFLLASESVV